MKLRNIKTGKIGELTMAFNEMTNEKRFCVKYIEDHDKDFWKEKKHYSSLAELNAEWEDYEEPKSEYYLTNWGDVREYTTKEERFAEKQKKAIGNYFETKEEAEKAVEKLKAWHKLMDYWETEILGWEIRDMPTGGNWQTVNVKFNVKTRKEPMELLDICFGGEDD